MSAKRRNYHEPFIALPKKLFFKSGTRMNMSPAARTAYMVIKAKFNGSNNGGIRVSYGDYQKFRGLRSRNIISKAIKELEEAKWKDYLLPLG
jgi:hypothetical protein